MATTRIWRVRDNLARVLEYAENHLKTANPDAYTTNELNDLRTVLDYAANSEKTAKQFYVTGINCIAEHAYQQMNDTKIRFGKNGGNLAYHAYQSFAPDEVTPQQCHDIGKLLAKRLWGDRYEVVVTTHLNTHCVHNHFVINSVSFVDGLKFDNNFAMYFKKLRAESDRICRERGLSVIEKPGRSRNKRLKEAEMRGEPTRYNVFKRAIDRAIAGAMTQKQFESILRAQGFEMKLTGKHWTIKMKGDKRPTRLYQLGENYTGEAIMQRILANERPKVFIPAQSPPAKKYRLIGSFHAARKLTGYRALYFYFLYRMGVLPKSKKRPPCNPILWEDVRQIRKYSEQTRLLVRNKIDTVEQLQSFMGDTKNRMDELIRQRTSIQNKLRRAKEPEVIEALKAEKTVLTEHITMFRRDLRIKEHLIPINLTPHQINFTYANEADMLNVALFGMTAKEWRDKNPDAAGNIRDYATIYQLIVLVNLESMNAELIKQQIPQNERLQYLNKMAIEQMKSLADSAAAQRLNSALSSKNLLPQGTNENEKLGES